MNEKVILAINNAFAVKKWIEPEEWVKVIVKEIGVKEIQLSFDLFYLDLKESDSTLICSEIKQALKKYDANISSTFTGLIAYLQNMLVHPDLTIRKRSLEYYEEAIKITKKIGGKTTGGHLLSFSLKDFYDKDRKKYLLDSFFESIYHLSKIAKINGLESLTWEYMPSPYEPPHTIEETSKLFNEVNSYCEVPIYLCFDLGHTTAFDLKDPKDKDLYYVLEKVLPYTNMLHLQQCDSIGDRYWPFTPEFNNIGVIDPKKILQIINDYSDNKVLLVFEFLHGFELDERKIIEDYKTSVDYWRSFL